ncbi:MAG: ABC transporter ATP-binding protein [Candidatus Korarchaeota archaeon]|nr:ABC transporter ATP-binding protein [Candidatus Korarchaeota archaeon]NIU82055.1 ATP-binding cassette domain-containing protein [Candidatus Thorarchaeota archaeon]NIW12473.1 ATP-binding cassette domain-containing protein [Candidatus Thorarchaeota archaeon]NIW50688.1 ATP-binding cassette domain-containing protein [Candidatus Korarchaeota archaeon]
MDIAVKGHNIRKKFGKEGILDGITLEVQEKEITLLMGPNGVGKTVLLCCLAGGLKKFEGTVRIFGKPPEEMTSELSPLLQGSMAVPNLTGQENIAFYSRLHPKATTHWKEIVKVLELEGDMDKLVKHCSGGMKRKIELAIALSVDVPLYFLDEPTVELDLSMIRKLHNLFLEEKERGKTFLITSHNPIDAEVADRILFLQEKGIVATGSPNDLLEDVPPVVRIMRSTAKASQQMGEYLIEGQTFERGGEVRGFLKEGIDVNQIKEALPEFTGSIERDEVSWTDMFNYYRNLV